MKTKILGWIATLGIAGVTFGFGACSQPRTECQVALASTTYAYAAKYAVKGEIPAACKDKELKGETLGMEFYHPPTKDKTTYDGSITTFAIQAESLMGLKNDRDTAGQNAFDAGIADCIGGDDPENPGQKINLCLDNTKADHPYALLKFKSSEPDSSDFCPGEVEAAGDAVMTFPHIPAIPPNPDDPEDPGQDEMPAKTVKYAWKNVKVYVTAAAPGTQFQGDLTYTDDDCTIEYSVVAMWPAIYCGKDLDDGTTVPDDTLCDPCPPPGAPYGSGISPDFPTKCDKDLLYCILADKKDAAKKNDEKAPAPSIPQILSTSIDCGPVE